MSDPTPYLRTMPGQVADSRLALVVGHVRQTLVDERSRWSLWLPVGVGSGVAVYFLLPSEPWRWAPPLLLLIALLLAVTWRRQTATCAVACAVATLAAGMGLAQWHAIAATAPVLERTLRSVSVEGRIVALAPTAKGARLTLRNVRIDGLMPRQTPVSVRISVRRLPPTLRTGDQVRLRATMSPPPGPAVPGAYDFQRRAWFESLGGVGYAFGTITRQEGGEQRPVRWLDPAHSIADLRAVVQQRIERSLDGEAEGLALALITGERGTVPESVTQALRDSGLAHLLAISGLHLGLVAGFVFLIVRGGLALVPAIALRYPIKKWAAAAAMLAAFGYLLLAGAPVPTQRAFVMTGLVLLAVMIDRVGISMRLVGWAALVVLLIKPDALTGASFQMSFAAVVALVGTYEVVGYRLRPLVRQLGVGRQLLLYLAGVALTSLVAGLATAPFALFHFDRLAIYGLAANMIAVPIAALWVMPCAVAALLLMPLGLSGLALVPMAWGLNAIVAIATAVAGWPGAIQLIPSLPLGGLVLIVIGGLWMAIWQRRWRFAGVPLIAGGVVTAGLAVPPDILVTDDGRLMGMRDGARLYVSSVKTQLFVRDVWLHRTGTRDWHPFGETGSVRCDTLACVAELRGRLIAFIFDPRALDEDCRVADIIVAAVPVDRACTQPAVVIDRFDLWREGAHAVWLGEDGDVVIQVRSVNQNRGSRPWVPVR